MYNSRYDSNPSLHSSIANNFNPLLFASVNDSFPLKFTNGHKRCVTQAGTQSCRFVPLFPLPSVLHLCSLHRNLGVKRDFEECRRR